MAGPGHDQKPPGSSTFARPQALLQRLGDAHMVELANCQATAAKDATTQALNVAWIHGGLRLFFLWGWGVLCSNCSRVVVLNTPIHVEMIKFDEYFCIF